MKTLTLTFTLILAMAMSAFAGGVETKIPALFGSLQSGFAPWNYSEINNLDLFAIGAGTCAGGESKFQSFPYTATEAIIEWATMDLVARVSPQDHMSCIHYLIHYLQENRPNVTRVVLVNAPPVAQNNYFGIAPDQVKAYNVQYALLPSEYPGYVVVADVWSQIVQPNGYARPPFMNGPDGVIFAVPTIPGISWEFFFKQVKEGL